MGKIYAVRFEKIGGDRALDCKIHILGDISIRGDHELQRVQFCRDDSSSRVITASSMTAATGGPRWAER